jgi:anaerobic magnesium-protoporphyrin IX monomethyl ester cyclase
MNVLLVSPYRGAIFELSGVNMQPLGVSYIGAALKANGHEVQIELLENQDTLPDFNGADVVGISCNTVQFNSGLKVAQAARAHGKTVIMGGPHPTSSPEETLRSGFVDYAVCGEGEATAVELLEGLKTGKMFDPGAIRGISWIDRGSGRIVHNPGRPFTQNLDALPFPIREANWRYGKNGKARPNGTIDFPLITTRGCPYGCKFCDVHLLAGRGFRTRSVENTVKEIEHILKNYHAERILIMDDIINFDNERLVTLFETLIDRGLPVVRWVMGRGDHLVKNPMTAEVMARAGVRQMFLGIENPSESILKAYKKGGKASSEVSLEAVKILRRNGIETWGAFLLGEPSETTEDIERTIEFAKFINPGIAQFSILTPFPGTELWKEVESKVTTRNWDRYDGMHSVFTTDHLDSRELEKTLLKAYMGFYRQPRRILQALFSKNHYGIPDLKSILEILKALKVVFTHQ